MGLFDSNIRALESLTNKVITYEKELKDFKEAISHSSEGIALLAEDGTYTFLNDAHASMFGYTIDEMLGNKWTMLYSEEDVAHFLENVFPIIAEKGTWSGVYTALSKTGEEIKESLTLKSLPNGGLVCHCRPYEMLFNTKDNG